MAERTGPRRPLRCDGCGAVVDEVTPAMVYPVPPDTAATIYGGRTGLVYIVCPPRADGSQPCLVLAWLWDEVFDRVRCPVPGCYGTRCQPSE